MSPTMGELKREFEKDVEDEYYDGFSTETKSNNSAIEPKHYTDLVISPLEYITANEGEFTWCVANVIKYVSRYKRKNGLEDLLKAKWYLEEQIRLLSIDESRDI